MRDKQLKELVDKKRQLEEKIMGNLKRKLLKIFDDKAVSEGFTIKELASLLFEKSYVSTQDTKLTYKLIGVVRKETDFCLAYSNKRYGWAKDKETIDNYRISNIENGLRKIKSNLTKFPINYKAIGLKPEIPQLTYNKVKEFGLEIQ
jgi:hypothetical protein